MLGIVLMEVRDKISKMTPEEVQEEIARAHKNPSQDETAYFFFYP